ncbi:MAG: RNA polymerase sigma factor [Planctomycetota bacterium]
MALATQPDPEQAVIEAVRSGDRSAFERVLRRNDRWVRGVIFGVLGEADHLDDVTQQVWQTVWSRLGDLRNLSQWRPWLYRLARNAAVDAGRDQTRRRKLSPKAAPTCPPVTRATPDRQAIADERQVAVLEAIRSLPAIYRQPFVLRHVEGWRYQQIAETMGMPAATVETRLVRARQLLREALAGKV